jgi:hypothetical protein
MPMHIDPSRFIQSRIEHDVYREAQSGRAVRSAICFGGLSIFFWTKTGVTS